MIIMYQYFIIIIVIGLDVGRKRRVIYGEVESITFVTKPSYQLSIVSIEIAIQV